MVYEKRSQRPLSNRRFIRRLALHAGYGAALVLVSLGVGTLGFATLAAQPVVDAFLNAAMLLGGMGPVGDFSRISVGAKIFASFFALYSGLVFLILAGLLVTPVFHRVLHRFHWEGSDGGGRS